ncbi:hypothetical protein BKA56DRAFT_697853 [Ilyonectria sp. MPI-CAGE-AT-0026]|nr:hypothetical protein BKA56DRAFT_697853 [Ilyonectria sp. MPI-CAGE-AT-0026]
MFDITRIIAGRELLRCLAQIPDWERAYKTVETAMQLVSKLISRAIHNADKQDILSQMYGLCTDAAAVVFVENKGRLVAFNFLEQDRGLVAASLEETRSDVVELQGKHPELAKQVTRLRKQTEELSARHNNSGDQTREARWGTHVSGHVEVKKELEKLLIEIRKQPEFEGFLTIPNEQKVKEDTAHGPITIINTSEYRCHAIFIERHQVHWIALPHPGIANISAKPHENNIASRKILNWLWETIADPIL